jgi:hypothetical protein
MVEKINVKSVPVKEIKEAVEHILKLAEIFNKISICEESFINDMSLMDFLAEKIEKGKTIEDIEELVKKIMLIKLIKRGHNTIEKLASVLRKTSGATKMCLHSKGLTMSKVKQETFKEEHEIKLLLEQ